MFGAIAVLFFLPWLDSCKVRSGAYRPLFKKFFWVFVANCFLLGYIGGQPAEGWYIVIGQVATLYYFFHFLIVLPWLSKNEKTLPEPDSIAASEGIAEVSVTPSTVNGGMV